MYKRLYAEIAPKKSDLVLDRDPAAPNVCSGSARPCQVPMANSGSTLLQLQHQYGNRYVQRVLSQARAAEPTQVHAHDHDVKSAAFGSNTEPLPDALRTGIESLSGRSLDSVRVHYNSANPPEFGASAYTQGQEIHLAPGQEQHLPHEAWHVVQQLEGRVTPTHQAGGVAINDDAALEREADRMGPRALGAGREGKAGFMPGLAAQTRASRGYGTESKGPIQLVRRKTTAKKKPTRRNKYSLGQHGFKAQEQRRLKNKFGISVSGKTHESEHTIGWEALARTSGIKRKKPGVRGRGLEFRAPAYQEVHALHRAHIGTGTRGDVDESGFSSQSYRNTQRSLIEQGDVSSAVQINQLAYAHLPSFQQAVQTPQGQGASDSFGAMVQNLQSFTHAQGATDVTAPVSPLQRAEMLAARFVVENGRYPTPDELSEIYRQTLPPDYWG